MSTPDSPRRCGARLRARVRRTSTQFPVRASRCAYRSLVEGLTDTLAARVRRLAPEVDAVTARAIAEESIQVLHPRLVDAATVATTFGVSRDWVYANASRLGAKAISAGAVKPRLRFYLHEVAAAIDGMTQPSPLHLSPVGAPTRRRRQARPATGDVTPAGNQRLPIRGT